MSFSKKSLGQELTQNVLGERISITKDNLHLWEKFKSLFEKGEIKFDVNGQLRYKHGAPVGEMILIKTGKDGIPVYKESSAEWFDPESKKAKEFLWP